MEKSFRELYALDSDQTFAPKYVAGCHCGAVAYSVSADPLDVKICHCRTPTDIRHARRSQSHPTGSICKSATAHIAIERVGFQPVIGDQDIGQTIAIHITGIDSHPRFFVAVAVVMANTAGAPHFGPSGLEMMSTLLIDTFGLGLSHCIE